MEALPSPFQETLETPTAYVKEVVITVTRGDETVDIEPAGGRITADARRSMRWDGELTIPVTTDLLPTVPGDLLTPFGTLVHVHFGVVLASSAVATVPFGTLAVDASNVELSPESRYVSLPLVDLAERIASYRFESPFQVAGSTDLADVVNAVVIDRIGVSPELDATGTVLDSPRTFGLDAATDPWRELADLTAGFGYRLWYDRTARLVLDQSPTFDPNDARPFIGQLSVMGAFDRKPPNVVVARGEAADGTTPVQAVVMDDDPGSPTYAGTQPGSSPYGRVTRYYASPLLTTVDQCELAASQILTREAAAAATWTVSKAFDPSVDPDDLLIMPLDETTNLPLAVDAVTVGIDSVTLLSCRAVSTLTEAA